MVIFNVINFNATTNTYKIKNNLKKQNGILD